MFSINKIKQEFVPAQAKPGTSLNETIKLTEPLQKLKKNSIMLVEFTTQILRNEKVSYTEALLKACPIRLRLILMTSIATVMAASENKLDHQWGLL